MARRHPETQKRKDLEDARLTGELVGRGVEVTSATSRKRAIYESAGLEVEEYDTEEKRRLAWHHYDATRPDRFDMRTGELVGPDVPAGRWIRCRPTMYHDPVSRTKVDPGYMHDIRELIAYYRKVNAELPAPPANAHEFYQDVTNGRDLMDAIETVQNAADAFDTLPGDVKNYCEGDPVMLLQMLQDPAEREILREKGLPFETPKEKPSDANSGQRLAAEPAPAADEEVPAEETTK